MLGTFQRTVVIVALVVLVIALIFVAIMLIMQLNGDTFPPYSSSCPDYWNMEKSSGADGTDMCINSKSLGKVGNSGCKQLEPTNSMFSGSSGDCNKYTYAKTCGVTWDGITNNEKLRKTC
jgi:hypothetical protein